MQNKLNLGKPIYPDSNSSTKLKRKDIAKLLIKWNMPTRQVFISELLSLLNEEIGREREYWQKYYMEVKYNWVHNWVREHIKKGLCRQCSRKAVVGRTRCRLHLDENNRITKLYKLKKKYDLDWELSQRKKLQEER